MSKVKQILVDTCINNGWDIDDESLIDTLLDYGTVADVKNGRTHRWYIDTEVVTEIDGVLIQYNGFLVTGDNSWKDMDLEIDLDKAKIVTRKERQVTEVYYE
ncbi:MAG: hypothetical protein V3U21_01110 [Thermodesulfobacteriota bacterium]